MTDTNLRELVELAAKAAGIPGEWNEQWGCFWIAMHLRGPSDEATAARRALGLCTSNRIAWGPEADDGDSRRLQVACRMTTGCDEHRAWAETWDDFGVRHNITELHNGDPLGMMRELVLRAAAEQGRLMP